MGAVTLANIRQAIRELGLSGQPVCLHTSLRSFGVVEGGVGAIVRGFLDEGCTVLAPTFSYGFMIPPPPDQRPANNGWDYTHDYGLRSQTDRFFTPASNAITEEEMGALPKWILEQPGRLRGNHPLNSFAALGPLAEKLIEGQTSQDVFAPLKVLSKRNGRVVLMGVGLDSMTLLHLAEETAGRRMFIRWANGPDNRPMAARVGGCSAGFRKFDALLAPYMRAGQVGRSGWKAYSVAAALRTAVEAIKNNPAITACGNPHCERCRDAIAGGPVPIDSVKKKEPAVSGQRSAP